MVFLRISLTAVSRKQIKLTDSNIPDLALSSYNAL